MFLTVTGIQTLADRGGFRTWLDEALEREAAVLRKIRSKQGIRMTAAVRADCLEAARYSFGSEINRQLTGLPFDPVQVFQLRFYAECYALAQLVQKQLNQLAQEK
jgi:hypothetical protein